MKLRKVAEWFEQTVDETLVNYAFSDEHWRRVRTKNPMERIMGEIRRRTRVIGAFPDGQSALNSAAAKLKHIAGTEWSIKRYMNMQPFRQNEVMAQPYRTPPQKKERSLTLPFVNIPGRTNPVPPRSRHAGATHRM